MTEQVRDRLERQGSRPRPLSGLMTHRLKVTKRSDPPRTATVPSNKHPITAEIQADISAQLVPPRTATGTPRGRAAESTAHKPRAATTCGRSGCRTKDNRRKEPGRPPPPPPPHANPSFSNQANLVHKSKTPPPPTRPTQTYLPTQRQLLQGLSRLQDGQHHRGYPRQQQVPPNMATTNSASLTCPGRVYPTR
jgi:hypothetical protein